MSIRRAFALVLTAALAACSQGAGSPSLPAPPAGHPSTGKHHGVAKARLLIKVPPRKHRRGRHVRGSRYVSPATMYLAYIVNGGPEHDVTIAPSNPDCTVAGPISYLQCTIEFGLPPGSDTLSISTYDSTGHLLSADTAIAVTAVAGKENQVSVTLGGVATSLAVVPLSPGVTGSQAGGFNVYGNMPKKFSVVPVDADNDFIVGPGAPQPVVQAPSGMTMSTPSPASPNTWTFTSTYSATNPTVPGSSAIAASATPVPNSGGSTVSSNVNLTLYQPWIYVNTCTSVCRLQAYDEEGNQKTLTSAFPNMPHALGSMAYDPNNGFIYVAGVDNNAVTAYDITGAQQTLPNGAFPNAFVPFGMAFDANLNWLYIADTGPSTVTAYNEQGAQQTTSGSWANADGPKGVAFDPNNDFLYVASSANTIRVYDEQGNQQTTAGSFAGFTSTPFRIAYDGNNGWLYATAQSGSVYVYDEQGNEQSPTGTWPSLGIGQGIAYDPYDGDLYIVDSATNTVHAYDEQGHLQTITGTFPNLINPQDLIIVP